MASNVYFSKINNPKFISPLDKITKLLNKCEVNKIITKNDITALKVHFGELGNTAFIRPIYLRPVIEILNNIGAKTFLTDTNTLYNGMRTNSVDHLHNAFLNGFNYSALQTPVIIADGLRAENFKNLEVNLKLCKKIKIASEILNSDKMIVVSHFKGHELSGFGGAVKNLSMGCASRAGKLHMHSQSKPVVKQSKCTACGKCITHCQASAIKIKEKAYITARCTGCSRCIAVCPEHAIATQWNESLDNLQKKMIEYAFGVDNYFKGKIIYINILTDISPACDCYGGNDKAIAEDIGFLASLDPVSIDKASVDLVINNEKSNVFKKIYPDINYNIQFEHSKEIGFGSCEYNLIDIDQES